MEALNHQPNGTTRRLSAIMFTDMVGYTALVQQDEPRARRDRDRQRAVLERHTRQHGGRILQTWGDGALSVFDSAIEAVSSAVEIQRELSADPRIPLRVGIHTGDIVYDDEGVFGDGVNVASRIQSLGTPGSVLVSAKVFDEIKNQPHLNAVSLGEFNLKNVQRPMEVFGITAEGIAVPAPESLPSRPMQARRSVAVLPFMNMSADVENEYFADGVTEELINVLTRVNGLQVTARTSSFAFKGRHEDVRHIAARLGVELVLEGSVRKSGDRVRITAQLIDASNGYHVFSETYDRRLSDIFELQDEIAATIVDAVQDRLAPERSLRARWEARLDRLEAFLANRVVGAEVQANYMRGLHECDKWTAQGIRRGIDLLQHCIAADATYAPAHAALARAHASAASWGWSDAEAAWSAAEAAARRAVELDPQLGEGHVALGLCELFGRWDIDAAYAQIQKALGLNPGSAVARHAFGMYLIVLGEPVRAVEEMEMAARLDPLSMAMSYALAWAKLESESHAAALEDCARILATDPTFRAAHELMGVALMESGRPAEAARHFERVAEITGDPTAALALRSYNFAKMGRGDEARRGLAVLSESARRNRQPSLDMDLALVHSGLGELDETFWHVEAAARKHAAKVLHSVNSPFWRALRRDPRYMEIIVRHGLAGIVRQERV